MKTLTSIVVAGALAATTIVASAAGASAGGWNGPGQWDGGWNKHRPHFERGPRVEYRSGPDAGGALLAGAFLGLAFGAIASQSFAQPAPEPEPIYLAPPHPNYAAADAHFTWCTRTYSSYNGERDTFIDFQGIERVCIDPNQ
jgi:hypothetical protein